MRRSLTILLSLTCAFLLLSFSLDSVPEKYRDQVSKSLDVAGKNRSEIEKFMEAFKDDPQKFEAACFLVAYMPQIDLASLKSDFLVKNLDLAFRAREEYPWGKDVPFEYFLHYVLPYRIAQEPAQNFRELYYDRIKEMLKGVTSMGEAAVLLNAWAYEEMEYQPTSWRDMGPLTVIAAGFGRCEEMMILSINALRTAGIPARSAFTPYWPFTNSNHAWVEVWTGDRWHSLGGAEIGELDASWFAQHSTPRTIFVFNVVYGIANDTGEEIYKNLPKNTVINSTPNYRKTGKVVVKVKEGGKPVEGADVYFYVFNFGALRSIAHLKTDKNGKISISAGLGDVFISAGKGDKKALKRVKIAEKTTVELNLTNSPHVSFSGWLRYPATPISSSEPPHYLTETQEAMSRLKHSLKMAEVKKLSSEASEILKIYGVNDLVLSSLEDIRGNAKTWVEIFNEVKDDPVALEYTKYLFENMTRKDIIETSKEFVLENVEYAQKVRNKYPVDDETFKKYVLNPRIFREEVRPWRKAIYRAFKNLSRMDIKSTAKAVNEWIAKNIKNEPVPDIEGGVLTPIDVYVSGYASKMEASILAVGILRSLGVPARLSSARTFAEFYDGKEWLPLYPFNPENLGVKETKEGAETYAEKYTVRLRVLNSDGTPIKNLKPGDNVNIGKWGSNGYLVPDLIPDEVTTDDAGYFTVELPAGTYFLYYGVRNGKGEPFLSIFPFEVKSDAENVYSFTVSFAQKKLRREDLVDREVEVPDVVVEDVSGEKYTLRSITASGKVFLVGLDLRTEPPRSMLPSLVKCADVLRKDGVKVYFLYLDEDPHQLYDSGVMPSDVLFGDRKEVAEKLGLPVDGERVKNLPFVMMIEDGKVILYKEGFDLTLGTFISENYHKIWRIGGEGGRRSLLE